VDRIIELVDQGGAGPGAGGAQLPDASLEVLQF